MGSSLNSAFIWGFPNIGDPNVVPQIVEWDFPKIRVPYSGGPYHKDPTI